MDSGGCLRILRAAGAVVARGVAACLALLIVLVLPVRLVVIVVLREGGSRVLVGLLSVAGPGYGGAGCAVAGLVACRAVILRLSGRGACGSE